MKKLISLIIIIILCPFITGCNYNFGTDRLTCFSNEDVATLNIFTYDGAGESKFGIANLGHSFLSIKNISNTNIILAGKEILPNEELYFGAWSLSTHFGIWFNVECNYIELYNKYNGRISIEKGISNTDLEILSDFILSHDTWNPINNCSYFAIKGWNCVAKEKEKLILNFINTPSNLKKQLKCFKNYVKNKPLEIYNDCGYFSNLSEETFEFIGGEVYV